jgi:PRC-barrel domain
MIFFKALATTTILLMASSATTFVLAQGTEQTVTLTEVVPSSLAMGYRSSKVVGSAVYNDAKEKIGNIDDLIITTEDTVPYAVISVGGFLGMGKHHVVVAASSLKVVGGQITLGGGSKEALKALPGYTYTY